MNGPAWTSDGNTATNPRPDKRLKVNTNRMVHLLLKKSGNRNRKARRHSGSQSRQGRRQIAQHLRSLWPHGLSLASDPRMGFQPGNVPFRGKTNRAGRTLKQIQFRPTKPEAEK